MTIPIVPGPFSFLEGAGEALGEIGKARRTNQDVARKGVESVTNLVQLGILPADTMASPEMQHLFQLAGLPPQSRVAPQPKEKAAAITSGELNRVQPGTPAARAVSGVPSNEVAGAGETAAVAQAGAVTAKSKAETSHSVLQEAVSTGALGMIGTNPEAAHLAQEAALGLLPLRIAKIQNDRVNLSIERQANADEVRVLLQTLDNVGNQYRTASAQWDKELQQAMTLSGIQPEDTERAQAFLPAFQRLHPQPTFDGVRDDYLKTQMGITAQEFQSRLTAAMDRATAGSGKTRVHISAPAGHAAPYPANRPQGQRTRVDKALVVMQELIKTHGGFDDTVAKTIEDSFRQHAISATEIRSLLARLQVLDEPAARDLLQRIEP